MASSAATPPPGLQPKAKTPKPPKLLLDRTFGPQPDLRSKFKTTRDFRKMYRAHPWLQGYDLKVVEDTSTIIRLVCATEPDCTFSVTALYATFEEPPLTGQTGYHPSADDFHPTHNHLPPFIPMDEKEENLRRSKLQHDDPSLEAPPLVRVQGFAGSDSDSGSGGGGMAGGEGHAGPSAGAGAGAGRTSNSPPTPAYGFASAADGSRTATPSAGPTVAAAAARRPSSSSPVPPPSNNGFDQTSPPPAQHYQQTPAQPTANAVIPRTQMTALQQLLLEIDPRFEDYFQYFGNIVPLSTPLDEILALDTGSANDPEDNTVFNMFRDIKELPLLLVALAADGIRKAKIRLEADPNMERLNPRIAEGIEKARAEKWVRDRIRQGQAILASSGAQEQ
ncbi:hypothetical protein JCM10908_007057 [Rhodotorula pacifica]|uniref:uncharacterized protein n=1 Tax=Rhodotorula pacifica TaxID=1495444 RepID=UPI0031818617